MASKTAIGNRALEFLGQGPVTSIDSSQPAAKSLRRVFDDTRRALLEDHPWNFAKKRASIPASATAPAFGFARGFPVPADFIRLVAFRDEQPFSIEADPSGSQWILTDAAAPLDLVYIYDVTDTGRYPPSFAEALAAKLAFDLAEDITQSNTKKDTAASIYTAALLKAKTLNGLQRQAVGFKTFSFVDARRSFSTNWRQPRGE